MDYKQAVAWLKTYKDMYYKVEYIENKMQGIKAISYAQDAAGGMPKTINDYLDEKEELEAKMKEIEDAIRSIPDLKQRTVLEYKYLEFMSFEKISGIMFYSISGIFKLHRQGVNEIIKKCKK